MKNLRLHLIYLAIIGFLTYQYWTKAQALEEAVQSIEMLDKLLKSNNEVVKGTSNMILRDIERDAYRYYTSYNLSNLEKSKKVKSLADSLDNWFEKMKSDFIIHAGGFDKKDST